ncbi:FMN-binding negative transcriptional regulator [Paucibacter sp. R3-3]|uniref:FMN-binding negative transcriptional regulator n=1 Tax=Roseateles agri TaxID=3098619 RepID=A0ABU5DPX2_9BURK|nr:FMN-binding negative transcriptional regulator [Paucibacter sp. R3-3]MDY0748371.1 FMN-binding negative transcriptional regulator [Paucibacter sp. R3-3]
MDLTSKFDAQSDHDLTDLVAGHPLAWLCSMSASSGLQATPLPLLLKHDEAGRLVAVEGHFARGNTQVEALRRNPEALVLWMGVQGYVSPSWLTDRTQAPSWNYASAQCRVRVRFLDDDEAALSAHLDELARRFEAGRPGAWSVAEMGARLQLLAQRVIAFRAEVVELRERYKLGQDERDDVFGELLAGLDGSDGGDPLAGWMRRFNPGRG